MTTGDPPPSQVGGIPWSRVGDVAVRLAGALVSLAGGVVVATAAVLAVPWRVDTWLGVIRLPLALLFAVAGAAALLWFAPRATGTRWAVLLPAAGWFLVAVPAMRTTREGSFLLIGDDVLALLTLLGGTFVIVVGTVLTLAVGRPRGAVRDGRRPLRIGVVSRQRHQL